MWIVVKSLEELKITSVVGVEVAISVLKAPLSGDFLSLAGLLRNEPVTLKTTMSISDEFGMSIYISDWLKSLHT